MIHPQPSIVSEEKDNIHSINMVIRIVLVLTQSPFGPSNFLVSLNIAFVIVDIDISSDKFVHFSLSCWIFL